MRRAMTAFRLVPVVLALFAVGAGPAVSADPPARASSRILYSSDWTGHTEIFALDPARPAGVGQLTFAHGDGATTCALACGMFDPQPSPDGRHVVFRSLRDGFAGSFWVARADGRDPLQLVARDVAWSPDSRRLAYSAGDGLHVARPNGTSDRVVLAEEGIGDVGWSPDGKTLAFVRDGGGLRLLRGGRVSVVTKNVYPTTGTFAWSPDGRWLAISWIVAPKTSAIEAFSVTGQRRFVGLGDVAGWAPSGQRLAFLSPDGLRLADLRKKRGTRLLTSETRWTERNYGERSIALAWAPDGRSVAYVAGSIRPGDSARTGDLRSVTLSGKVRTLVSADRRYGGRILSLAWTRPPAGTLYRAPEPAPPARAAPDGLLAGGWVTRLAADGGRVAFASCFSVYAWTPATGEVRSIGNEDALGSCRLQTNAHVNSLALAGDRVAYGKKVGCHSISVNLFVEDLGPSRAGSEIAAGRGSCGAPFRPYVGYLVGADELLAFSSAEETCQLGACAFPVTTSQQVNRVDESACPCPAIASSPGRLVPADVDGGRIVAFGENETLVLDADGTVLDTISVSPLAAQLSGSNLVLLRRGELRHYDADSGALRNTWALPDVPSGGSCEVRCPRPSEIRLLLQDAAHGLVAYVLDGEVRLLRLADGATATVARGTIARFADAGLVYADGSRLHLVPFEHLPLSGA